MVNLKSHLKQIQWTHVQEVHRYGQTVEVF
jgi:hypothetical protein